MPQCGYHSKGRRVSGMFSGNGRLYSIHKAILMDSSLPASYLTAQDHSAHSSIYIHSSVLASLIPHPPAFPPTSLATVFLSVFVASLPLANLRVLGSTRFTTEPSFLLQIHSFQWR